MQRTKEWVELQTSELYHRHKRNLLLFSAAAIVLSVADQADGKFKLPGLEMELTARWAFLFIGCAILYSGLQFLTEFFTTVSRNAHGWAKLKASALDDAFAAQQEAVDQQTASIQLHCAKYDEMMGGLQNELNRVEKETAFALSQRAESFLVRFEVQAGQQKDALVRDLEHHLRLHQDSLESGLRDAVGRIMSQVELVEDIARKANGELTRIANTNAALRAKFQRLSDSITGSQRWGMTWLDGVVPALMAVAGISVSVLGVIGLLPN